VLSSVVEVVDDVVVLGGTQWQLPSQTKPPTALPVQLGSGVLGSHSSFGSTMPLPQLDGSVDVVVELVLVDVVLDDAVVVDVVVLEVVAVVFELVDVVLVLVVVLAMVVVVAIVVLVVLTVGAVDDVVLTVVVVVGQAPTRGTQRRISSSRSFRLSEPTASTEMRRCPYFLPPRWSGTVTFSKSPQELAVPVESGAVRPAPFLTVGFFLSALGEQAGVWPFKHMRTRKLQPLPQAPSVSHAGSPSMQSIRVGRVGRTFASTSNSDRQSVVGLPPPAMMTAEDCEAPRRARAVDSNATGPNLIVGKLLCCVASAATYGSCISYLEPSRQELCTTHCVTTWSMLCGLLWRMRCVDVAR